MEPERGATILGMPKRKKPSHQRSNDPEGKRNHILDVACSLFVTVGYHATGMQDVLAAAKVTSGALHHHFPTKKQLGLAAIKERVAATVASTWITPIGDADLAIQGALSVMRGIAGDLRKQGEVRGCPLNNLALELAYADPEFRVAIQDIFDEWTSAIAVRIRRDQKAGWRKDIDPVACANFIVSAYSGAMALSKAEQSEKPLVSTIKMLKSQFI